MNEELVTQPKKEASHRSGFVALVGRPNAGKSTLLNRIIGTKLAAVSPRPQTTRHRIFGIYDRENVQIVFQDTPGLLEPDDSLHQFMVREADRALMDADLVVWLIDSIKGVTKRERIIAEEKLAKLHQPLFITFNKIDSVNLEDRDKILSGVDGMEFSSETQRMEISALQGHCVDDFLDTIISRLEPGPKFFPPDQLSDRTQRFFVEEIIREKAFLQLKQEIPYSLAVQVEEMKERADGPVYIRAVIHVERDSQKGIVVGKNGARIKQIGTEAREEIAIMLGKNVYIELWAKVTRDWRRKDSIMKDFGYRDPE